MRLSVRPIAPNRDVTSATLPPRNQQPFVGEMSSPTVG